MSSNEVTSNLFSQKICITETDIKKVAHLLPVIVYLAGYCCNSVFKKIKCAICKENLTINKTINLNKNYSLIQNLDRGGLLCPVPAVINLVMYNYITLDKIVNDSDGFFNIQNQKQLLIDATFKILESNDMLLQDIVSDCHKSDVVCRFLLSASSNIMLNNLCSKKNDRRQGGTQFKKRKLQTLNK